MGKQENWWNFEEDIESFLNHARILEQKEDMKKEVEGNGVEVGIRQGCLQPHFFISQQLGTKITPTCDLQGF